MTPRRPHQAATGVCTLLTSKSNEERGMRTITLSALGSAAAAAATMAGAQGLPPTQPPLWSSRPDVAAFEKIESRRLDAAQRSIDKILAVKGPKTVDNTLANYDEAIKEINSAYYFSSLMEAVHPDAGFRDHATAMTRKVSAAQTALSLNRSVYQALAAVPAARADAAT